MVLGCYYSLINEGVFSMDNELTLKTLIEGGRDAKNFSQRELSRRIGLSNTSLNNLEKGKFKR